MKTRSALLREASGKWLVEDVAIAECRPDDVQLHIKAAGICHSDDHLSTGDLPTGYFPFIGGHEGAGVVTAVGSAVTKVKVGDHVVTTFMPSCGHCTWCALGMGNLCDEGGRLMEGALQEFKVHDGSGAGVGQMGFVGTWSEHTVVPDRSVVKIDEDIPFQAACLVACGVPTGWGAATHAANVQAGDVIIVMGTGGVGMNSVQAAHARGAAHVLAVDPSTFKRDQALTFGATAVFEDIDTAAAYARELTNGQGADATLISVGVVKPDHIGQAMSSIRKAGTVVLTSLGNFADLGEFNMIELTLFQKRIQGSLFGTLVPGVAVPNLLALYKAGKLKLDELITRTYNLNDVNEAIDDMHAGRVVRGVIDMERG